MYSEFQHLNYDLLTIKRTRAPAGRAEIKRRGVVVGWFGCVTRPQGAREKWGEVGGGLEGGEDGFASID